MADHKQAKDGSGNLFTMYFKELAGNIFAKGVMMLKSDGTIVDPIPQVAHGAVDAGEPVKFGAKAVAGIASATPVDAADRTDLYAGLDGVFITRPYCGLEDIVRGTGTATASTGNIQAIAALASHKHYITTIVVTNTSATQTEAYIKDGTTTVMTIPAPATSGAIINLPVPLPQAAANTAWNIAAADSVSSLNVDLIGFKSKV